MIATLQGLKTTLGRRATEPAPELVVIELLCLAEAVVFFGMSPFQGLAGLGMLAALLPTLVLIDWARREQRERIGWLASAYPLGLLAYFLYLVAAFFLGLPHPFAWMGGA